MKETDKKPVGRPPVDDPTKSYSISLDYTEKTALISRYGSLTAAIKKLLKPEILPPRYDGYNYLTDTEAEKIGVTYAHEAYKSCQTLQDFQDKQKEIENRSFNFLPTLGLK